MLVFALLLTVAWTSQATSELWDTVQTLEVGIEKIGERLPLDSQGSSTVYGIRGLHQDYSYEIKISYPASIPTRFSLTLVPHTSHNRRLLDVEKIIFPAKSYVHENAVRVLVTAKPVGVIAKRNYNEQPFVVYNILCERVYFGGIPKQAWWIASLAAIAVSISLFLPKYLRLAQSKLL